jgi:DNA-binding NarL/FixJ family response regulator
LIGCLDGKPLPLRCLIAEDHAMFAQLVGGLLRSSCHLEIVAISSSVAEALAAIDQHHPRLLILDLDLPDGSGLAVAQHLLAVVPEARVLVLSAHASQFVCPDALQPAVIAVVDKTQAWEELVSQVADYLRAMGAERHEPFTSQRLESLTGREREVLHLLGQGEASKAIARTLGLSLSTVDTHRRNIAAKLGVSGAELIRLAVLQNFAAFPPASAVEAELPPA